MPSTWPNILDSFVINRADGTGMGTTHKDEHNNINDALNKIEQWVAEYAAETSRDTPLWPKITMMTAMQSGHGATNVGGTAVNLNDTAAFALGTQSAKLTTVANTYAYIQKHGNPAFNMNDKQAVVWVWLENWYWDLLELDLLLGNNSMADYFVLPISGNGGTGIFVDAVQGPPYVRWHRVVLNWGDLRQTVGSPNKAALTDWAIRIRDNEADPSYDTLTLHFNGWGTIPEPAHFPNGVVSVTFDDSWDTQYTEGKKKMDQYGFPATEYVIVDQIGAANHMTLAQLKSLQDHSGWQIGAHAWTQVNHDLNYDDSLTAAQIEADFRQMRKWLKLNGFRGYDDFAWPGGSFNNASLDAATRHFRSARAISARVATSNPTGTMGRDTIPPYNLNMLRAISLRGPTHATPDTPTIIQGWVDNAYANGQWLNLVFHEIKATPASTFQYSITDFATVIDYLNTKGIPVMTVDEVLRAK
jgi:peptidoglycan/xylan/chitin deacetylase (PgdA/CDA1 family)